MDWFRWHHGTVADRKWPRIASRAGTTVANVIAVWAALLEAASQAEDRGAVHLSDDDCEDLDAALGMPADTTRAVIAELCARDLIGADNRLTAWDRRQPRRERDDNSAERVRKYRERQRAASSGEAAQETPGMASETGVTPCNAAETEETPRGEEIRGEEKRERRADAQQRSPKGARLSPGWMPSAELAAWASVQRPDVDVQAEAERFRDYWAAKPGKDGVKLDWDATFRNWVRNARVGASASNSSTAPAKTRRLL